MADFSTALRGRISAAPAVSSAVGTRIYPSTAAENAPLPYIRYQVISDDRPQHLRGYQSARTSRVQFDIFSTSYVETRAIAESIIAAVATPGTFDGIYFGRVKAEGPRDLGEDVDGIGFVYRASLDLLAEHTSL